MKLLCIGCQLPPEEIMEYRRTDLDPTEFVIQHEGTYNMFSENTFYCTECYEKAGYPVSPHQLNSKVIPLREKESPRWIKKHTPFMDLQKRRIY